MLTKRLRQLREEHSLSQDAVAKQLNLSRAAYGYYEQGIRNPHTEVLEKLAGFYDCSVDYLLGLTDIRTQSIRTGDVNTVPIPVVGVVRAGAPILASENIESYVMVTREESADGEYFYLRVVGDSMNNAHILDGSIAYVRQQPDVDNRDIAVVIIDGENATIKRVIKTDDGMILQPESTNPVHTPMYFRRGDDVRIIGKVLHVKFQISS